MMPALPAENPIVTAAREWFELGATVLRCENKKPIDLGWTTLPPEELLRRIVDQPSSQIGLRMGTQRSGSLIIAIDVDGADGRRALEHLESELGALPVSFAQETGGGGLHLVFRWPADRVKDCPTISTKKLGDSIDIRGIGGQIVAAPSIHESGNPYRIAPDRDLADVGIALLPDEWVRRIVETHRARSPEPVSLPPRDAQPGGNPVERARRYVEKMPPAIMGSDGSGACWRVAQVLVRGFSLNRSDAARLLTEYNARCEPPWSQRELNHKLDSADKQSRVPLGFLLNASNNWRAEWDADDSHDSSDEAQGDPDWGAPPETYTGEFQGQTDTSSEQGQRSNEVQKKPDRLQKIRDNLKPWRGDAPPKPVFASEYMAIGIGRPSIIAAPPGSGKSWLAMFLAMSVSGGTQFGDLDAAKPARSVLWLDYEQGDYELHRREALLSHGCSVSPSELATFASISNPPPLNNPDFQKFLEGYLKEHKVALVIVDTLTNAWPVVDRSDASAADPLVFMNQLSERTGAAFTTIYHLRKMKADDGGGGDQEMILGSVNIAASAQSIWLCKKPGKNRMEMSHVKCNSAPKSDPFSFGFEFDRETGGIRCDASRISKSSGEPETKEELQKRSLQEAEMKILPLAIEMLSRNPDGIVKREMEAGLKSSSGYGTVIVRDVLGLLCLSKKIHLAPKRGRGGGTVYRPGPAPAGSPAVDDSGDDPEDES